MTALFAHTHLPLSIVTVGPHHSGKLCVVFLTNNIVGIIAPIAPASSRVVSFVSQLGHQQGFRKDEWIIWLGIVSYADRKNNLICY